MSARDNILNRIRTQSGKQGATTTAELDSARSHIARRERGPLPSIAHENPLQRFINECDRLKSTVETLADKKNIPQALARYLSQNSLKMHVVGWPSLVDLDWVSAGIQYENRLAIAFIAHHTQAARAAARNPYLYRLAIAHCGDDGRCLSIVAR
jgi:hypothetical protein